MPSVTLTVGLAAFLRLNILQDLGTFEGPHAGAVHTAETHEAHDTQGGSLLPEAAAVPGPVPVSADKNSTRSGTADREACLAGAASPAVRHGLGMILSTSSMRVVNVHPQGKPVPGAMPSHLVQCMAAACERQRTEQVPQAKQASKWGTL